MKKVTIKKDRGGFKAYREEEPNICGVGRSKSEAMAALYLNMIGKLILEEPERFNLEITFQE